MELMILGSFWFGIACIVIGVAIALFPSNYEIIGMEELVGEDGGRSSP